MVEGNHLCFLVAFGASEHFSNIGKQNLQSIILFSFSIILLIDQRVLVCNQISLIDGFGVRKSVATFGAFLFHS